MRISIIVFMFFILGCKVKKELYGDSNLLYKKQANAYAKVLNTYPLKDSSENNFVGTTNFNMRKPNYVVIHHTAQNSCDQTLKTFTLTKSQVSAHYVICKSGQVYHMLNDYLRAWHGGASKWGSITDMNSVSIGIELDNNGNEVFSDDQIKSLETLLKQLKSAYAIPSANFIGHSDIAPSRKVDPNKYFPWKSLAQKGFGIWYDTTNVVIPYNFNTKDGLKIIGYDVKNEKAAIKAFKLHFNNNDTTAVISKTDEKIIYSLMQKN